MFSIGCGAGAPVAGTAGAVAGGRAPGSVSQAPSWARAGDRSDDSGHFFVCEGTGATKIEAEAGARSLCSSKICNLCGVEIQSVVETSETLETVEVQRKVVERCRRVRKSEEQVRYEQSSCAPEGCVAWVEVFYSREKEALECKAYAQEDFADPEACERLVAAFRETPGLTAASFDTRVSLLTQAIVACADIDVRPTPRLQALDEVLWQGVLAPALVEWKPEPDPRAAATAERVAVNRRNSFQVERRFLAERTYAPVDRQGLIETKIFVDRLARVRGDMAHFARLMHLWETVLVTGDPGAPESSVLTALMTKVEAGYPPSFADTPGAKGWGRGPSLVVWARVLRILGKRKAPAPEALAWFKGRYPAADPSDDVGAALVDLVVGDGVVNADEWAYLRTASVCLVCNPRLFDSVVHEGGEIPSRAAEVLGMLASQARSASPTPVALVSMGRLLAGLSPAQVVATLRELPPGHRAVMTWEHLEQVARRIPPLGASASDQSASFELLRHLGDRLLSSAERPDRETCADLDQRILFLEERGLKNLDLNAAVCVCLGRAAQGGRPHGDRELYLRAVATDAPCVKPEVAP